MRAYLALSVLGVLAGLAPVSAQSRTSFAGLSRRTSSDTCAVLDGPFEVWFPSAGGFVTFGYVGAHALTCQGRTRWILTSFAAFRRLRVHFECAGPSTERPGFCGSEYFREVMHCDRRVHTTATGCQRPRG